MDIESYLQKLSLSDSGEDLEYSTQFNCLALTIERGGEDVQYGDHIYQPIEMDWRWGAEECEILLKRSLDLRVAVYQTHAWLMQKGLSGFLFGLQVILYLLEKRWEDMYPQLLKEDNWDPLCRLNSLAYLSSPHTVIARLRQISLVTTSNGDLSFELLEGGKDTEDAEEDRREASRLGYLSEPAAMGQILRAFGALKSSLLTVQQINTVLCARVDPARGGGVLSDLEYLLQRMVRLLQPFVKSSQDEFAASDIESSCIENSGSVLSFAGVCRNRHEVVGALDAICQYYRIYEPNSPIPLFIERARKLVDMNFLQIINELMPEGNDGIRNLVGMTATNE